jgi:hypothetical protein
MAELLRCHGFRPVQKLTFLRELLCHFLPAMEDAVDFSDRSHEDQSYEIRPHERDSHGTIDNEESRSVVVSGLIETILVESNCGSFLCSVCSMARRLHFHFILSRRVLATKAWKVTIR